MSELHGHGRKAHSYENGGGGGGGDGKGDNWLPEQQQQHWRRHSFTRMYVKCYVVIWIWNNIARAIFCRQFEK